MDNEQKSIYQGEQKELSYDLKITNGAAKKLSALMTHFDYKTAKEVVALSLELLDAVKDSNEIIIKDKEGNSKLLTISNNEDNGKSTRDD